MAGLLHDWLRVIDEGWNSKETTEGESRVALVPDLVAKLAGSALDVYIETGAGGAAGFADRQYADKSAHIGSDVLSESEIILKVRPPTATDVE